ncbi:MAG: Gfo/Idh/MocA family protein, partial [Planctomycetota bacterium]
GFMGTTHWLKYQKLKNVKVVAISDERDSILEGKVKFGGNLGAVDGPQFKHSDYRWYKNFQDLLNDPNIDMVDICVPTFMHAKVAVPAYSSGKAVLLEKPLAWKKADAVAIRRAAAKCKKPTMVAMCIRYWPEWHWLKSLVEKKTYGKLQSLKLRRVASNPAWSQDFYLNDKLSGSCLLDLHVHDTDFVTYICGRPESVSSSGTIGTSSPGGVDQVLTHYKYKHVQHVTAEGSFYPAPTFGFYMQYLALFEKATVTYDIAGFGEKKDVCVVHFPNGKNMVPKIPGAGNDGWFEEIKYFTDCVAKGKKATISTVEDAVQSLEVIYAEEKSVRSGKPAKVEKLPK